MTFSQPAVHRLGGTHGKFCNEIELQTFFERRLKLISGHQTIASSVRGGRRLFNIDTLVLDKQHRPVVIEYKWDEGHS